MPLHEGTYTKGTRVILTSFGMYEMCCAAKANTINPIQGSEFACQGTISRHSTEKYILVTWDNGFQNCYDARHLDLAPHIQELKDIRLSDLPVLSLKKEDHLGPVKQYRVYPLGEDEYKTDKYKNAKKRFLCQAHSSSHLGTWDTTHRTYDGDTFDNPLAALRDVLPDVYGRKAHQQYLEKQRQIELQIIEKPKKDATEIIKKVRGLLGISPFISD